MALLAVAAVHQGTKLQNQVAGEGAYHEQSTGHQGKI